MRPCAGCSGDMETLGSIEVNGVALCPGCFARSARNDPGSLELATVDELVQELLRRSTFRGVIIHQDGSYRGTPAESEATTYWRWFWGNCNPLEVVRKILPLMKRNQQGG